MRHEITSGAMIMLQHASHVTRAALAVSTGLSRHAQGIWQARTEGAGNATGATFAGRNGAAV